MERKFELTCTHTVWSIVGCPFSLCRRPTSAAPIQISGKWLFENFTPPGKRLKTVLELQVRYFHLANQVLWKGKLNPTAMKQDTRVDTSCSEQRMGKSWLRTGSGSRVACEQTVNRLSVWGKVPPRGDVFFEQKNIKTRRKPVKKWLFCYIFVTHSTYRKRLRASGDVPCASEDMACGYWFSKWRTTKSIWVR